MDTLINLIILVIVSGAVFVTVFLLQGYSSEKQAACSLNQCIMKTDGSQKICPTSLNQSLTPNFEYTTCVDSMTCPSTSLKYAVHEDGSALTNTCDVAGCPCSLYRRCPPYILTIFRLFGAERRISYFQVMDPLFSNAEVSNPFSPPYTLNQDTDQCFVTQDQIPMIYPFLSSASNYSGNNCIRGVFAEIASKPRTYGCVPEAFVNKSTNIFDDAAFNKNYVKPPQ